jgi:hypothetical protein
LHAILTRVMKSCAILLHPALPINHLFIQSIRAVYTTHLLVTSQIDCHSITEVVFRKPLFYIIMVPKCKVMQAMQIR